MSYQSLEEHMKNVIQTMKPGTEFYLSDIIMYPPAGLGRLLFKSVQSGNIKDVICIEQGKGKDRYRKL